MDIGLPLYRSEDVRAIDRAAIEHDGIAAYELMERAGKAAFEWLREAWPQARRFTVLCGPGNNGGDGYVLARLAHVAGRAARVIALAPPATPEAQRAALGWRSRGGTIEEFDPSRTLAGSDVLIDALFGIGLTRAPEGAAVQAIAAINAARTPVLALDVPSGLDADRGRVAGECVRATRTISFIAAKRGLYTGLAREWCGEIRVATLEVREATRTSQPPAARLIGREALAHWLRPRARAAHKGAQGHVLAIGGDLGYAGAIALCAEAALRCGAGLVSVATRMEHVAPLLSRRPEAMVRAIEESTALQPLLARADVLALGPGLGQGDWGRSMFEAVLDEVSTPCVLDADALNLLARAPRAVPEAILTPHPGEAARLLDTDVTQIEADRYGAAQAMAERYQAIVVLKGAGSLVAAPQRTPVVIGAGNPGMASGGMGDVLTGAIAALRAQGLDSFDAACAGALLHAVAGDAAAADGGERGLIASDLFVHLRRLANPA